MTRTWTDLIRHGEPENGRLYRGGIDFPWFDGRERRRRVRKVAPEALQDAISRPYRLFFETQ